MQNLWQNKLIKKKRASVRQGLEKFINITFSKEWRLWRVSPPPCWLQCINSAWKEKMYDVKCWFSELSREKKQQQMPPTVCAQLFTYLAFALLPFLDQLLEEGQFLDEATLEVSLAFLGHIQFLQQWPTWHERPMRCTRLLISASWLWPLTMSRFTSWTKDNTCVQHQGSSLRPSQMTLNDCHFLLQRLFLNAVNQQSPRTTALTWLVDTLPQLIGSKAMFVLVVSKGIWNRKHGNTFPLIKKAT